MLRELVHESARNVRTDWLRVLLTGSGIAWGIALFLLMMAFGGAVREHYREKLEVLGRKAIYAFPGSVAREGTGDRATRRVALDEDDPGRLLGSPLFERAGAEIQLGGRVIAANGHVKVVWTYGVGSAVGVIRSFAVARGRFLAEADVRAHRRVVVLGAKVEERLFGRRSALGQEVRIEGWAFRVIGVSAPKGQQMVRLGPHDDEQALIPVTTAQRLFTQSDEIGSVLFDPVHKEDGARAVVRTRELLGPHHRFRADDEQAITFFNVRDAIVLMERIGAGLQVFLGACGVLTLAVGAVGVMNIMLVAVAERTRELAVRKALGARRGTLFCQVLIEASLVTAVAGAVGLGIGGGLLAVVSLAKRISQRDLLPTVGVSPELGALSVVVLVVAGVLAGVLPAVRAARLDPAVAIRDDA